MNELYQLLCIMNIKHYKLHFKLKKTYLQLQKSNNSITKTCHTNVKYKTYFYINTTLYKSNTFIIISIIITHKTNNSNITSTSLSRNTPIGLLILLIRCLHKTEQYKQPPFYALSFCLLSLRCMLHCFFYVFCFVFFSLFKYFCELIYFEFSLFFYYIYILQS